MKLGRITRLPVCVNSKAGKQQLYVFDVLHVYAECTGRYTHRATAAAALTPLGAATRRRRRCRSTGVPAGLDKASDAKAVGHHPGALECARALEERDHLRRLLVSGRLRVPGGGLGVLRCGA